MGNLFREREREGGLEILRTGIFWDFLRMILENVKE